MQKLSARILPYLNQKQSSILVVMRIHSLEMLETADNGYELIELKLVDMFAQTSHFETMGLFSTKRK